MQFHNFLMFPYGRKKLQEGPRYGDMYERSLAAMIDLTLIYVLLKDLFFDPLTRFFYSYVDYVLIDTIPSSPTISQFIQTMWDAHMVQLWLLNAFVQFTIIGFFMVGFQITYQTTPGKWLLGLKIVRHNSDESVGATRYIVRFFAYIIACAPLMLGMIWGMFSKQRRGWHDYIADTMVISTRPQGWYWQKIKQGFGWVKAKLFPARPIENTVTEPAPKQSDKDGDNTI